MPNNFKKVRLASIFCFFILLFFAHFSVAEEAKKAPKQKQITGRDVVSQCDFKNPGNDQRSQLSITLIDQAGNERKNVFYASGKI